MSLKIINRLENANQNHNEIPVHNHWSGYWLGKKKKKTETAGADENIKKLEI